MVDVDALSESAQGRGQLSAVVAPLCGPRRPAWECEEEAEHGDPRPGGRHAEQWVARPVQRTGGEAGGEDRQHDDVDRARQQKQGGRALDRALGRHAARAQDPDPERGATGSADRDRRAEADLRERESRGEPQRRTGEDKLKREHETEAGKDLEADRRGDPRNAGVPQLVGDPTQTRNGGEQGDDQGAEDRKADDPASHLAAALGRVRVEGFVLLAIGGQVGRHRRARKGGGWSAQERPSGACSAIGPPYNVGRLSRERAPTAEPPASTAINRRVVACKTNIR